MFFNYFRRFLLVLIISLMSQMCIKCEEELCQKPTVYSMDRFNNNTIRMFRENYVWDLSGFPDKTKVGPKGSMKDYQFLQPINKNTKIVTILEGSPNIKDRTYKFEGLYWWSWYRHPKFGLQNVGSERGLYWKHIPKNHGFDAVFHNGDKNDPMLIGLESDPQYSDKHMKIHYFSTQNETFDRKRSQYFDEKDFPKELTDAFSWPPNKGLKYLVFLLKSDKYCILSDKQKCTEWKAFKQLIGCTAEESQPDSALPEGEDTNPKIDGNGRPHQESQGGEGGTKDEGSPQDEDKPQSQESSKGKGSPQSEGSPKGEGGPKGGADTKVEETLKNDGSKVEGNKESPSDQKEDPGVSASGQTGDQTPESVLSPNEMKPSNSPPIKESKPSPQSPKDSGTERLVFCVQTIVLSFLCFTLL